jgi:hypothetical protein
MVALPGSVPTSKALTWPDDIFGKRTAEKPLRVKINHVSPDHVRSNDPASAE